jgi:hypothetical protein
MAKIARFLSRIACFFHKTQSFSRFCATPIQPEMEFRQKNRPARLSEGAKTKPKIAPRAPALVERGGFPIGAVNSAVIASGAKQSTLRLMQRLNVLQGFVANKQE